jgi:Kef-type K+ transport system membrane component KefB
VLNQPIMKLSSDFQTQSTLVQELIMIILLPLYFTYLGLKTDLSTINSHQAGVSVVLIILASMIGKIGGAAAAARLLRNSWRCVDSDSFLRLERSDFELCVAPGNR